MNLMSGYLQNKINIDKAIDYLDYISGDREVAWMSGEWDDLDDEDRKEYDDEIEAIEALEIALHSVQSVGELKDYSFDVSDGVKKQIQWFFKIFNEEGWM